MNAPPYSLQARGCMSDQESDTAQAHAIIAAVVYQTTQVCMSSLVSLGSGCSRAKWQPNPDITDAGQPSTLNCAAARRVCASDHGQTMSVKHWEPHRLRPA